MAAPVGRTADVSPCAIVSTAPSSAAVPVPRTYTIDLGRAWADPRHPNDPPTTHLQWAENIARLIACESVYGFGARSAAAEDLVQVAHACLVSLVPRFDVTRVRAGGDPDGQFRGWSHRYFPKECRRAAEIMLNAGLYRTTNDEAMKERARRTGDLPPQARCPNCRDVQGWWGAYGDEESPEDVTAWLKAHGYY